MSSSTSTSKLLHSIRHVSRSRGVRSVTGVFVGVFFGAALYVVLLFGQTGTLESELSTVDTDLYYDKSRLATLIKQPKLLIISGSNATFSTDCATIEKQIAIPCLNGATTAHLGVDYHLYRAKQMLHRGDYVALPLEWHHYANPVHQYGTELFGRNVSSEAAFNRNALSYFLAGDMPYFKTLSFSNQLSFLVGIPLSRVAWGYYYKVARNEFKLTDSFDHIETDVNVKELMGAEQFNALNAMKPLPFTQVEDSFGSRALVKFFAWCRENGVTPIGLYPSTADMPEYADGHLQSLFQSVQEFYRANGVAILGDPKDFFYPRDMLYDTMYHLHSAARLVHSAKYAKLLAQYLHSKPVSTPFDFEGRGFPGLGAIAALTHSGVPVAQTQTEPQSARTLKPISLQSLPAAAQAQALSDGDVTTGWLTSSIQNGEWNILRLDADLGSAARVDRLQFRPHSNNGKLGSRQSFLESLRTGVLAGSQDGGHWSALTVIDLPERPRSTDWISLNFPNSRAFRYYRLLVYRGFEGGVFRSLSELAFQQRTPAWPASGVRVSLNRPTNPN